MNYACALLANVTRTEKGAAGFTGLSFPKEAVPSSMTKENGEEEKEHAGKEEDGSITTSTAKKDTSKPTATLLLSRFLNPTYVDATLPVCKSAMKAFIES